ncbi:hypothetical protein HYW60_00175 [Candidatus Kaiserbacteria bacterium]|nr:hypothetical protein [Candidatus Kaiserbacteria bacterium]
MAKIEHIDEVPSRRAIYLGAGVIVALAIALATVTHADERGERPERPERPEREGGTALSGTTTSTWTVHAIHVEDKTRHPKPPKPPKVLAMSTVQTSATTTAQLRIDALLRVIERLQAIVDQWKVRFSL